MNYYKYIRLFSYFILGITFILILNYHFHVALFPYQIEYREGSELYRTTLLSMGKNIYNIDSLPLAHSQYGFIYNIVVLIIGNLFNLKIDLIIHRLITGIFILLSCILVAIIVYKKTQSFLNSLIAFILFYVSLIQNFMILGYPGVLGMFLFLCSIYIPYLFNYNYKSLIFSLVLGLLAFYTKIYFILGLFYISCYLFIFVSKKKGVLFGFLSFLLLAISLAVCNYYLNTYIDNTVILSYKLAQYDFLYFLGQTFRYAKLYWGILLLVTIYIFNREIINKQIFQKVKRKEITFAGLKNFKLDLSIFSLLLSIIVITIKFGGNTGTYLQYYLQLISPFLIISVTSMKFLKSKSLYLFVLVCLLNILTIFHTFTKNVDFDKSYREYTALCNDIKKYKNIFNSPAICSILIDNKKRIYDTGQVEYLKESTNNVLERYNKYLRIIQKKTINKNFDAVYITKDYHPLINRDILESKYYYSQSFQINMINQKWIIQKWLPVNN